LSGAWLFHMVRGQLEESRQLAQDCVDGARIEGASDQQMAGQFLLGASLFHLGQLAASWEQIDQIVPSSDAPHPALALFAGPDVGVFRRAYLSHLLCQFGEDDKAVARSDESIARAREVSHPFTLGIALDYAAMLHVYRGDSKLALARAAEASEICRKHGFAYYLALAEILAGWATGMEGDTAAGLMQLRRGLDTLRSTGAELRLPFYYGLLAEINGLAGKSGEALANIASGFAFLSKNAETWIAPEVHRIHGDLLRNSEDTSLSRASYQRAIEWAKRTGSRLFEQRSAARLRELANPQKAPRSTAER